MPKGRTAVALAGVVLGATVAAGCSAEETGGDLDPSTAPTVATPPDATTVTLTPTPTPSESSTPLPVPAGVELTTQGSQLAVGDTATVAYQPRRDLVAVLDITVKRLARTSIRKSFVGWDLNDQDRQARPYFVTATLLNRGTTDLGGRRVPLYIVDGTNTLIESTKFESAFPACEPGTFPDTFPPGARAKFCMVYLAPADGTLAAVSFRPTQDVDPITWTGEIKKVRRTSGSTDEPDGAGAGG